MIPCSMLAVMLLDGPGSLGDTRDQEKLGAETERLGVMASWGQARAAARLARAETRLGLESISPVSPPCPQRPPPALSAQAHTTHTEYWTIKSPDK